MSKNDDIVTLIDNEGKEFSCRYIATVDYNNSPYAILFPMQKVEGIPEDSMIMFRMVADADGSVTLEPVTDEKEQDGVNEKYMQMISGSCGGDCGSCGGGCGKKD